MPHLFVVCPQPGPIENGHTGRQEAETSVLKREGRSVVDALCPVADCAIEGDHAAHASQNERGDEQLFRGNLAELANFQWRASDGLGVFPKGEPRIAEIAFEGRPKLLTADPSSRKQQEQDNHGNWQSPTVEPFCVLGPPRFRHFAPLSAAAVRPVARPTQAGTVRKINGRRSQDRAPCARPVRTSASRQGQTRAEARQVIPRGCPPPRRRSDRRSEVASAACRASRAVTSASARYSNPRSKGADSWLIGPKTR